jgi:biopolymer transport protein ExbB
MKRKTLLAAALALAMYWGISSEPVRAQDAAAPGTLASTAESAAPASRGAPRISFWVVVTGSGWFGVLIWVGLFGTAGGAVYFAVDSLITLRPKRIMPEALVDNVTRSMKEGDVLKALESCESEPGPLANVLTAGFSHVEEGFEVIQDAVSTAADLEIEKIAQKLNWISVMAALSPMLGLLGTVQGMIMAFANISTGTPDIGFLAMAIAQALYTTAAGLTVAIPGLSMYYQLRNSANKTILRMEAMTMELIKDLRHVEVVES